MQPEFLEQWKLDQTPTGKENNASPGTLLSNEKIVVMDKQECLFITVGNICYIEGEGSYSNISLQNGKKLLISKNLKVLAERLSKDIFFRIHNSYVINVNFISKYVKKDGGYLIMEDGSNIPVSVRKKEVLLQLVQKLSL